ncbi:MAG: (2Fe-2S) ferredoxin domain-containing protein [Oscillospiraceae bacterium]|nr:(2Fe-2S) ferredoxin domain-containing protein [Oscillospiraceae bacterium]
MNIYICVGSSCHLKGSFNIIQLMKEHLAAHGLEEKVTLAASFCLGKCTHGVTIKVDDEIITGVSPENFEEIFNQYVLGAPNHE